MDYQTITKPSEGYYKEKGSKFYSFAFQVHSEDEVREKLDSLRKKYHDARHHCYAFHIGMETPFFRVNDDGEPGHSAGDPILGQIRSYELTNVLIVVIRYFGGTKLGVGGLIHAYKTAAEESLKKAEKRIIFPTERFEIAYNYNQTAEIEKFLHNRDIRVENRIFDTSCRIIAEVRKENYAQFARDAEQARIRLKLLD